MQIELLVFGSNTWNHLTVCKQIASGLFKNLSYKLFLSNQIDIISISISVSIYLFLSLSLSLSLSLYIYIYIYLIIIIMSCHRHGHPWPFLATSPYCLSPLAGLQGYILYPHRAAVCMFELVVLLLLGHIWGSIGVQGNICRHIWWFVLFIVPAFWLQSFCLKKYKR